MTNEQRLIQKHGMAQVTKMKASLRQIEATNPALFSGLVSQAITDSSGGFSLPIDLVYQEKIVRGILPTVDRETALAVGEAVSRYTLICVAAEALF